MCFKLSCIVLFCQLPWSMGSLAFLLLLCRSLLFSGSPTKVGDKMVFFLFEVLVTRGDVTRGTLLIPVEAALQYFPSPADLQTYQENIHMQHITDTPPIVWLMFLSYDKSECCYVVDGIWQTFVSNYHLFVGDVIRFYKPSRVWENNSSCLKLS